VKRSGAILCIALACALAAGANVAGANAPATIASGVTIGSVDVGGMTASEAKAAVKSAYYTPIVVRVAHHFFSTKARALRISAPVTGAVQTALTAPSNSTVQLAVKYDHTRAHAWLVKIAAQSLRPARPGAVVIKKGHPKLFHAHFGHAMQMFATHIFVRDAINGGTRSTIVAPLKVLKAPDIPKNEPIIVIHRGSNRLVLFNGERYRRSFAVATGQPIYPTPLGHYAIVIKEMNPWWYPPTQDAWAKGLKPVPPGPGNPLGTRWMGLSAPGVGIHGTNEPWSIGHSESHGCIRMQVADAEWLYPHVRVGTPVFILSD
jgi:lipoprotein-anchoring transpeptidase ErfK/SrfK